jgi:hypothetical protein
MALALSHSDNPHNWHAHMKSIGWIMGGQLGNMA